MIQRMFVTLDTKKTNYKNVGKINHGDDLILELTVLSDGDMISFNDPMVDLLVKKSDGKMIRQNSGIEHIKPNKFVIEVSKDCVTSPGLSTNQLIINDNGRISTCMFYYTILNSLEEDIIESVTNVEVLEQLDEFTIQMKDKMETFDEELQNRMSELEDAIDDLVESFGDTSVELLEAELSRNEAEQSRAKAESIRVQNESRRLQNDLDLANAEAERVRAENIRIQNEADRALVDAVMDQKESKREDSELERIQNESKRIMDEVVRQQNENTRQSNESIRMSNETDRKTQENRRVTTETNRVNAETTRRNNENSRISNESERQKAMNEMKSLINEAKQNENARQSNESIRMSNETDRKTQENRRVTTETNRVNAEKNRVNAETTRRNNENSRISNEAERQKAMNEMKSLIDKANSFADVHDSKIDFFGKEHDKLSTRLNADFDNVHQRINESEILPYEGCSIKADNSYYGFQKDTVIKGRTLQNLCVDYSNKEKNTFTLKDKVTMIGSDTKYDSETFRIRMLQLAYDLKANTTYTFIVNIHSLETAYNTLGSLIIDGNGQTQYSFLGLKGAGVHIKKYTTNESGAKEIGLYVDGQENSATISYPMILEGDHTQTPLEELPFIEGIESVGDKSRNLFYGTFEEGQISVETGEEIDYNGRCRSVQYINIEPNKTYTVSIVQNVVSAPWTSIRLYKDDTYIKTVQDQHGKAKFTFESGEANRSRVTANIPYNDVINCQMEEGTQATPYQEHYVGYKISGKSCGKNLVKSTVTDMNHSTGLYATCEGNHALRSSIIKLPKGNYSLSFEKFDVPEIKDGGVLIWDNTDSTSWKRRSPSMKHFEILEDEVGITWYGQFSTKERKDEVVGSFIQIEEGIQATPYEPYQESNYSYILNEPLRSLPDGICDSIDLETGVLTRRVSKYVFDGSENWSATGYGGHDTRNTFELTISIDGVPEDNKIIEGYCNRFIYEVVHGLPRENGIRVSRTIYDNSYTKYFVLVSPSTDLIPYRDLTKWKEYLQENNLTVYVKSVIPTTEQLTPQQLKSFDTTTHIISDNKLMPVISTKIPSNVQAIISTLKLENSDLKNNVEVLSVENEELKETNIVQDEMIDISMMATDEMYSMLEPLLENIPMPMKFEEGVSKLVYLYVAMVQRGLKTLDEVPTRYREQVRAMI